MSVLVSRWVGPLGRFLTRATGSRETGEDLLQETFLRILRAAPSYVPRGEAKAWIYRIASNLAYSHWRRRRLATGVPASRVATWHRDTAPAGPEDRRAVGAFARDLESAVGELSANHRVVFLLKADQGLTYEEIAQVLCCPSGTVKSRFHHAARRLRVKLREWEGGIGHSARGDANG